jgi:hypothetical protein
VPTHERGRPSPRAPSNSAAGLSVADASIPHRGNGGWPFEDSPNHADVPATYGDDEPGPPARLLERYPGCTQDHLDVYRGLYWHAKQDGTRTFPKLATLADDLARAGRRRIPPRTLDRRLRDLKAWGWVRADREMVDGPHGGQRRAHNKYALLVPLVDVPMVAPRSDQARREGWRRQQQTDGGATVRPGGFRHAAVVAGRAARTRAERSRRCWPHGATSGFARPCSSCRGASRPPAKRQFRPWRQGDDGATRTLRNHPKPGR